MEILQEIDLALHSMDISLDICNADSKHFQFALSFAPDGEKQLGFLQIFNSINIMSGDKIIQVANAIRQFDQ